MGRRLTDRELLLRAARAHLRDARREARALVADAQSILDALSRCDWCGCVIRIPAGKELQLCRDCTTARLEQLRQQAEHDRVALLATHGYDAKGRKVAVVAAANPSATPQ
jgi:hypothetical protein